MKRTALTLFFTTTLMVGLVAQGLQSPKTYLGGPRNDAWELGIHAGHFFTNGNVKFTPGYGGGFHVRRALDYVFSLRLDVLYGSGNGEDDGAVRTFENQWIGGSLQGVISLNNLRWSVGERKNNFYLFGGFGINSFSADMQNADGTSSVDNEVSTHGDIGVGLSFRINERVNFGIEHKATYVFGDRADLLDGVPTVLSVDDRQTFRDVVNYTGVRLNINIGNMNEVTEPLYWVNPMEETITEVNKLKERPYLDLTDTDGDGVIDQLDQEPGTPSGAPVDARGVSLDSDGDGIADVNDQEPYSPPGYQVDGNGVAQVPDDAAEMRKYLEAKIAELEANLANQPSSAVVGGIYLPNLYFGTNGSRVTGRQFGTLGNVATVLRSNPGIRIAVVGHADADGNPAYNQLLSYQRAKNTIDKLVENFNVSRDRLVLQYKGEAELLLPGAAEVNRRVEFKVAEPGDTDMTEPK